MGNLMETGASCSIGYHGVNSECIALLARVLAAIREMRIVVFVVAAENSRSARKRENPSCRVIVALMPIDLLEKILKSLKRSCSLNITELLVKKKLEKVKSVNRKNQEKSEKKIY